MKPTKVIVTSEKNLKAKYGKKFPRIDAALKTLVKADKQRDIETVLVYMDSAKSMKQVGVAAVSSITPQTCKAVVDKIYRKHFFDYITLVGAQDVFPFQSLDNPTEDEDRTVPSDLPYACEAAYNTDVTAFTGPTRVVSRIPDVPYSDNPKYLETLIRAIVQHKPQKATALKKYFSVSAKAWQKSTELSLNSIFGEHKSLLLSPVAAPVAGYSTTQLKPLVHFYNCHGALGENRYFGQDGTKFPTALDSKNLTGKVTKGTIVAAECCYGAELIDPATIDSTTQSISNTYLGNEAVAFMGSSTISYGPEDSQGLADLITQYFVINTLEGMSTGRALLEARQKFLSVNGPELDPYELKTLAQFYLLGDCSVHAAIRQEEMSSKMSVGNTVKNDREKLSTKGKNLHANTARTCREDKPVSINKYKEVKALLTKTNFAKAQQTAVYSVTHAHKLTGIQKAVKGQNTKFHTFIKTAPVKANGTAHGKIKQKKVLVVKENQRQILGWRIYVAR